MKRFTLIVGLAIFAFVGANAQTTTKVSKQIEMLEWLNKAVVDGNQVGGGLHSYANWTEVLTGGTAKLKTAEVKLGMLITLTDAADAGTYRLRAWATPAALPLKTEWERVGDVVVVADIAARNALITGGDDYSLAIGTVVLVRSNTLAVPQAFIYVENMDGDANINEDEADSWFTFGDNGASNGYIYFLAYTPLASVYSDDISAIAFSKGYYDNAGTPTLSTVDLTSADTKFSSLPYVTTNPNIISFDLVTGWTAGNVPAIALPATWAKPSFYIYDGTNYSPLLDCWVSGKKTIDGVDYQVWVADNAFADGATGTLNLIVRR